MHRAGLSRPLIGTLLVLAILASSCSDKWDRLSWDEAAARVGESATVCGPVASVRSEEGSVLVNVGEDYPDPKRFVIVVSGSGGVEIDGTDEQFAACVSGQISEYRGVPQVEVQDLNMVDFFDPSQQDNLDQDIPGPY